MDSEITHALHSVPDDELLRRLAELVSQSRRVEADLILHLGEVDERRLYARQAFPSMFAYSTEHLHLSEAEAYRRITVARAARKHAALLAMLRDGRLHLSGIALLAPFLTADNRDALLERATHLTKRELERLVAELSPRPDVPSVMRKLPQRSLGATSGSPGRAGNDNTAVELGPGRVGASPAPLHLAEGPPPAPPSPSTVVEPLSPSRYKVQFTGSSSITGIPSEWAAITAPTTSACCALDTIGPWPNATMARRRSGDTSPARGFQSHL